MIETNEDFGPVHLHICGCETRWAWIPYRSVAVVRCLEHRKVAIKHGLDYGCER